MLRPGLLMCPPTFFGVDDVINPWLDGQVARTDRTLAQAQWQALPATISAHADIELVAAAHGLPDMVLPPMPGLSTATSSNA